MSIITARILFCLIIVIFVINVFWGFPDSPAPWFDEGINLGIAKTYAEDGVYSLRLGPDEYVRQRPLLITTNYPLLGFIIASFKIFGVGLVQAKAVMMFFLTAFLVLSYYLTRRLYNNIFISLASLALVITFLPFYGNGLSGGLGEVPGLVYLFAGLLLIEGKKWFKILLGGFFIGLCAATKVIYLSAIFAVFCNEILLFIKKKEFDWKRWLILALGIAIPLFFWIITLLPPNASWVDLQNLLSYYGNPYQTGRSIIFTNILKFFTETTPIHFVLLFSVFVISGLARLKNYNNNNPFFFTLFIFIVVNILWFLETPGWYRYFFPAQLIVLVFFPGALNQIFQNISYPRVKKYGAIVIILSLVLVQSIHLIRERSSTLYYNSETRLFAEHLEQEIGDEADVVIIDHPELWFLLNNPSTRQFIHLNPHLVVGDGITNMKRLPQYIISSNPLTDNHSADHRALLESHYVLKEQFGHYFVFEKNSDKLL